jgi:cytoskeletal protein CcmA (bactofilin family)
LARLVIDEGVFFEGACKMGTQATPQASTAKTPEKESWAKEKQTVK